MYNARTVTQGTSLELVRAKPRIAEKTAKAGQGDAVMGGEPGIGLVVDETAFFGQGEFQS